MSHLLKWVLFLKLLSKEKNICISREKLRTILIMQDSEVTCGRRPRSWFLTYSYKIRITIEAKGGKLGKVTEKNSENNALIPVFLWHTHGISCCLYSLMEKRRWTQRCSPLHLTVMWLRQLGKLPSVSQLSHLGFGAVWPVPVPPGGLPHAPRHTSFCSQHSRAVGSWGTRWYISSHPGPEAELCSRDSLLLAGILVQTPQSTQNTALLSIQPGILLLLPERLPLRLQP